MAEALKVGDVTPDGKVVSAVEKIAGVRAATIKNLRQSVDTTIQVSGFVHTDVSGVVALKDKCKAAGHKVSITEIFAKVIAMAIEKHPEVNAGKDDENIYTYSSINMGIAVGTETGQLIVPVIKNCESKSLLQISADMKDITERVKTKKLTMDMFAGGTFTISSIGMFGADNGDSILNIPQSGIIAIGRIKKEFQVGPNDEMLIKPMAYLTLTIDHAVINGAPSSMFMRTICEIAEKADELIPIE